MKRRTGDLAIAEKRRVWIPSVLFSFYDFFSGNEGEKGGGGGDGDRISNKEGNHENVWETQQSFDLKRRLKLADSL